MMKKRLGRTLAISVVAVLLIALGGAAQGAIPKYSSGLSVDELYEKAKQEGKVVIYAKGSKFIDVKASFEARYPGITVEPYKISSGDLIEKLRREHNAGVFNVDLVHIDTMPSLVHDGYITPIWPEDIM